MFCFLWLSIVGSGLLHRVVQVQLGKVCPLAVGFVTKLKQKSSNHYNNNNNNNVQHFHSGNAEVQTCVLFSKACALVCAHMPHVYFW